MHQIPIVIRPAGLLALHITWLVLALSCADALAQAERIITTREGLPQSFVSGVAQDQVGFVWVGTRNGLARYDGVNFNVFQHNKADQSSLASNLIITIKEFDRNLWIEHESGEIDWMDPVSEKIRHHPLPAGFHSGSFLRRAWIADSRATLWRILDGVGLIRYGPQSKVFSKNRGGFDSDTLWGLREGTDGKIWVVTRYGLSRLDPHTGKIKNFRQEKVPNYHDYRYAVRLPVGLHQRKNGDLMWADRAYLYFFSPGKQQFVRKIPFDSWSDRGVTWIQTGPDGNDYFERGSGVYRYSQETGLTLIYGKTVVDKDPIQSFLVDRSGLVWLGTNAHGILQVDVTTPFFPSFPIQDGFAGDVLKAVFKASLASLFAWNSQDQRFAAAGYHIRSTYDKRGSLWIGLKEKVVRFDPVSKQFSALPTVPQIANPVESGIGIKGLTTTPAGEVAVIGYNRNVLLYNWGKKSWDWLIPPGEITRQFGRNIVPQDLFIDDQTIWITTEMHGLILLERGSGQMRQLRAGRSADSLPTDQLLGIKPDPSRTGLLWIGSRDGLVCLNKKTLKAQTFNSATGLPDNTVYSLLADDEGTFWLGTNKGLCRFNPVTHKVRVYQTRHGLLEDEFNRFHQLRLPDGRLAFGGTNGWTLFDPKRIRDDAYQPAVALTALKINNESTIPSATGLITKPLPALGRLELPHDQNTVTFIFAGLQFNQPLDLQYRYKLSGYDTDWVSSGNIPFANYTKIPPGSYEFTVNASNTSGQWSPQVRKLALTIRPPWWQTWWAYGIYGLFLVGLIRAYVQYRLHQTQLQQDLRLKEQEAQLVRENAQWQTRFFTNITHEFRTPLTLIINPLERLLEMTEVPSLDSLQQPYGVMHRNAHRLLRLINQLLDMAKLEARHLAVTESPGNLVSFFSILVDSFRLRAERQNIVLTYEATGLPTNTLLDAQKLETIGYNLLDNALKFTPPGGHIRVVLRKATKGPESEFVLQVADSGLGIAPEQLLRIFDRFYQGANASTGRGTGIGLFMVAEFTKLLGGQLAVESKPGAGTTFTVTLPLREPPPVFSALAPRPDPLPMDTALSEQPGQKTGVVLSAALAEAPLVLVVEDNDELREFITGELAGNYRVITAANGAEGWDLCLAELPELVLSDVMMPVMDGFTLVEQIKTTPLTAHIAVILLTARTMTESRLQGLTKGANDYLTKPFHSQELLLRVANLLRHQQQLRQYWQQGVGQLAKSRATLPEAVAKDPFLMSFYRVVDQHVANTAFGVEQLSDALAVSARTLHRKLSTLTGSNANELLRSYRLEKAAILLREGCTVSEAAEKTGFEGLSYFSKSFKAQFNVTPSAYLHQAKKN